MALSSKVCDDGRTLLIEVGGRFDFALHTQFRAAQESAPSARDYIVDLGQTEYMDSSALGMLLVLHEHAGKAGGRIIVRNCKPMVRKIFEIANFHKLFTVE